MERWEGTLPVEQKPIRKETADGFCFLPPQRHRELPFSVIVLQLANLNWVFSISCHTWGTSCRRSSSQVSKRPLAWSVFSVIRKEANVCFLIQPCVSVRKLVREVFGTLRSMSSIAVSKASSVISSAQQGSAGQWRCVWCVGQMEPGGLPKTFYV